MSTPSAPLPAFFDPKKASTHPSNQLTISQAAQVLGVNPITLRRWEKVGRLTPNRTLGGKRRYSLNQLQALQEKLPIPETGFNRPSVPNFYPTKNFPLRDITRDTATSARHFLYFSAVIFFLTFAFLGSSIWKTSSGLPLRSSSERSRVLQAAVESLGGIFKVNLPARFTNNVLVGGSATVSGTLAVTGNVTGSQVTLSDDITVNGGDLLSAATAFNLAGTSTAVGVGASTGTTTINHNLKVAGTTTLTGAATLSGAATIAGKITGSSTLEIASDSVLKGALELTGKLTAGGAATIAGATTLSSTLTVTGLTTLSGNLDVNGTTNDIAGTLNLSGNALTSGGDLTLTPAGADLILANATVINIGGSGSDVAYNVIGDSTTGASASMDSDDDLYIEGSLEVDGTIIGSVSGSINPGLTEGSVLFQGPSGIAGDATNFFWNDSTNWLGLGDSSPDDHLDIEDAALGYNFLFGSGGVTLSTATSDTVTVASAGNISLSSGAPTLKSGLTVSSAGVLLGETSETISTAGFTMDGDDLFIAGLLGTERGMYSDGNIAVGSGTNISPDTNLGSDLGTSSIYWNNLYVANINTNNSLSTTGQAVFTYDPPDPDYDKSSVLINPTAPETNDILLGLGQGGNQRAGIDAEGDLIISYSGGITAPSTGNPLTIYNHGTSVLATIDSSGNMGIGTDTTPDAALAITDDNLGYDFLFGTNGVTFSTSGTSGLNIDTYGSASITSNQGAANAIELIANAGGIDISTGSGTGDIDILGGDAINLKSIGGDISLSAGTFTTASGITLDSATGYVGIGTASPTYTMDIYQNDPSFRVYASTNSRGIRIIPSNLTIEAETNNSLYLNRFSAGNILLGKGGGNVGINDDTPDDRLDIDSTSGYNFMFGANGVTLSTGTTTGINIDTFGSASITSNQGAANALELIATAGGIDISTGSGTGDIDILGGDAINLKSVGGAISLSAGTGQSYASGITIDTDGQVGIGDSTPSYMLDVTGDVNFTGRILEDGNEIFSGVISAFATTCPTGWSEYTAARGRYVVGTPSGGTIAATVGTALGDQESRVVGPHAHGVTDPGHSHTVTTAGNASGGSYAAQSPSAESSTGTSSNATGITVASTGSNISTTAGTNAPYIQLTYCQKSAGADYAEWTPSLEQLTPGDVVSVDDTTIEHIRKSLSPYDPQAIGIISTTPGWTVGITEENSYQLALVGRVPVKISPTSAPIAIGDYLTSSSEPGRAQKATRSGRVIGLALESWSPESGKDRLLVFVNPTFYTPPEDQLQLDFLGNLVTPAKAPLIGDVPEVATPSATVTSVLTGLYDRLVKVEEQVAATLPADATPSALQAGPSSDLEARLSLLEETILGTATQSSSLDQLGQLDQLEIGDDLTITGDTFLNNLSVTGTATIGTLTLDPAHSSINSLTEPLRIQDLALQPLELMGGTITIDTQGNLQLKSGHIVGNDSFIGNSTVPAGSTTIRIDQDWDATPAAVTVTPSFPAYSWVTDLTTHGFTVNLSSHPETDQPVYWNAFWTNP